MTERTSNLDHEHLKYLSLIEGSMRDGVIDHYRETGVTHVTVPVIVGITGACENIDTLFKISSRNGHPLFMTQTGQLALEQFLQVHQSGVYTIVHSGRDEEDDDPRHLRQFSLIEEELPCTMAGMTRKNYKEVTMFETLLQHIEGATKAMIASAVDRYGSQLEIFYGRNIQELLGAIHHPYLRITYSDALDLLHNNGHHELSWGSDLKAHHEQEIVKLLNQYNRQNFGSEAPKSDIPVFITKYPQEIKFFNMKVSETDPRVVLSADLILPISGESAGSAVREHDGQKLRERLIASKMFELHTKRGGSLKDFNWYLKIIDEQKTDPHAGYGIGLERVTQYVLGLPDIRRCSVMRILAEETQDWELPT